MIYSNPCHNSSSGYNCLHLEIKIALSLASLADDDEWQIKDPSQAYDKRRLRELDFWFGATTATGAALEKSEAQSPAYTARNRTR